MSLTIRPVPATTESRFSHGTGPEPRTYRLGHEPAPLTPGRLAEYREAERQCGSCGHRSGCGCTCCWPGEH